MTSLLLLLSNLDFLASNLTEILMDLIIKIALSRLAPGVMANQNSKDKRVHAAVVTNINSAR